MTAVLVATALGVAGCTAAAPDPVTAASGPATGSAQPCPQPTVGQRSALPAAALPRVPLTRVPADRAGWGLVSADGWLWTGGDGSVLRVDPAGVRMTERVRVGDPGQPVVVLGWDGQLWAFATDSSNQVTSAHRLDPRTGTILHRLSLEAADPRATIVVGSSTGMWYISSQSAVLVRIDPRTGAVVATTDLPPPGTPTSLGWGFGEALADAESVWVTMPYDGTLVRIDTATNDVVARICVAPVPTAEDRAYAYLPIGLGLGSVWVSVPATNEVVRVDPAANAVAARIALPANARPIPKFPTVVGSEVWVPSGFEGYRIDAATNTVAGGLRFLTTPHSGSDGIYQIVGTGTVLWTREEDLGYLVRAEAAS